MIAFFQAMTRSFKRNASIAFACMANIIAQMPLDLSRYAKDIVGATAEHFRSASADVRSDVAGFLKAVIARCSDSESALVILDELVDILNGKKGKMTQAEFKEATISAILLLGESSVKSQAKMEVMSKGAAALVQFSLKEPREATVLVGLRVAALLASKTGGHVPQELEDGLKTVLADSKASQLVKAAFLRATYAAHKSGNFAKGKAAADICIQHLSKGKPPSTPAAALEASAAAALALGFEATLPAGDRVKGTWPVFKTEDVKWSTVADDADAVSAHTALTGLVLSAKFRDELTTPASLESWYSGLITAALHPLYAERKLIHKQITDIIANHLSPEMHSGLIKSFFARIQVIGSEQAAAGEATAPSRSVLISALLTIVGTLSSGEDGQQLALDILVPCHDPLLASEHPGSQWGPILKGYGISASDFVRHHADTIVSLFLEDSTSPRASITGAIGRVVSLCDSDLVRNKLVECVLGTLGDQAFGSVTETDMGIYNTAEDMTYEEAKAAAKDSIDEQIKALNVNSKDYEDKKWELEAKRTQQKKKGAAAPKKKLSKHEAERRAATLVQEKDKRAHIISLKARAAKVFLILDAMVSSCADFLAENTTAIVTILLSRCRSLVVAEDACKYVEALGVVTSARVAAAKELICFTLLRAAEPACSLPSQWYKQDLKKMVAAAMRSLWSIINNDQNTPLDTASFSYCWPLLEHVLCKSASSHGTLEDALVFLSAHASLGSQTGVPHAKVIGLLVHVVANHDRLAHQAAVFLNNYTKQVAVGNFDELPGLDILIGGFNSAIGRVRQACLDGCGNLPLPKTDDVITGLYVEMNDADEAVGQQAQVLWTTQGFEACVPSLNIIYLYLGSVHGVVRKGAAAALASTLSKDPSAVDSTVENLISMFIEALVIPDAQRDHLGNIIGEAPSDKWYVRCGYAQALEAIADMIDEAALPDMFKFILNTGLADRDQRTGEAMLAASQKLISAKGKATVDTLLPIFEQFLDNAEHQAVNDIVKQSAVVLLGALAKHLEKTDPKIPNILDTLLAALSTPSQAVQQAVANCISPLVSAIKPQAAPIVEQLLDQLLENERYAQRRGAAYGLAGVVKGLGILALKQHGVTERLQRAIEHKKNAVYRESALMAYEMLCVRLGRLFEPYIVHILPNLLKCFGDGNKDVRLATQDTAAAIMKKLSSHGVKLVLPHLLNGLDDDKWKTKQGSVELLGAMANCAPKQLSACLPSIVPRLSLSLTDSHQKVQAAAEDALQRIGSVIRNPEIQDIVQILLNAIQDPNKHTTKCLQTLLDTAFVHVIDAASLALIMPILDRALTDRSHTSTKKMASQIIGNMYSLTDPKDLQPYLPQVLPGVKDALLDPEPSVRGIAAKALGSMMKGMGEETFPDLVPWLLATLRTEGSSVDRSGAAQGASEVLFALGTAKLDSLLPDFINGTNHCLPHIREGHMLMFVYLPVTFQQDFLPYVERAIPCILRGIADQEEGVRDTAMRAGTGVISHFSQSAIELLLPKLEAGLLDEAWRIRESSVRLLGELLYKISGMSGKKSTAGAGEDDNFGTEESAQLIMDTLGESTNNRILAGLYISRQDTAVFVRQAAAHVWKIVVHHTIKTVRQVLAPLIETLLTCLADSDKDKRQMAAKTLSEVVRKLGVRVLPEIWPILENGMDSEDPLERQGVSVGLFEIMGVSSQETILEYVDSLIPLVRRGLCDSELAVRQTTASTFAQLHACIGNDAVNGILPALLSDLDDPDRKDAALDGLRQIMTTKARIVLPYLVPRLTELPLSVDNAKALGSLTGVAGAPLNRYLTTIMDAFKTTFANDNVEEYIAAAKNVVLAVDDEGLLDVYQSLNGSAQDGQVADRKAAIQLLRELCSDGPQDLEDVLYDIIETLLLAFMDEDSEVVYEAWGGLNSAMERVDTDKAACLEHIVGILENMSEQMDGKDVPGFCIPKGIQPVFNLIHDSLQNGTPDAKLSAAKAISQVVKLTEAKALGPFILKLTGGLIRAASDNTGMTKAEMLNAMGVMLVKVPAKLKSMLPQLQPTCVKSLKDPNKVVRQKANDALDKLLPMQRRVDALLNELMSALQVADDELKPAYFKALWSACGKAGDKATDKYKETVITALCDFLDEDDEATRAGAASAMAAFCRHLSDEEFEDYIVNRGLKAEDTTQKLVVIQHLLLEVPAKTLSETHGKAVATTVATGFKSDNVHVQGSAAAAGAAIFGAIAVAPELVSQTTSRLFKLLLSADTANDVIEYATAGFKLLAESLAEDVRPAVLTAAIPKLMEIAKSRKGYVRQVCTVLHMRVYGG